MGKAIGKGRVWTVLLVMSILLTTTGAQAAALHPDKDYDAGQEMMQSGNYTAAAEYFREAVALNPSAANWKALGEALEKSRNFEQAAEAFFNAADIYQVKGLKDDAEIYRKRGESLLSYLNVFLRSSTLPQPLPYTGGKYEPRYGAYLGAYIDEDPLVQGDAGFVRTNFNKFNTLTGKDNAIFFTYVHYGTQNFPQHWVDKVVAAGAVPELAMEPAGLDEVQDNNYLREFARAAGQTGKPIFIRFASEANGVWTPYHASVLWDDASQTASFTLGGREVSLAIGQGAALVDGVEVKLDMPTRLINFSTMVPLRFVSESLGATVGWQQASRQVTVTY